MQKLYPLEDMCITENNLTDITIHNVLIKEVVTMMMTLFDEEQLMKNHDASIYREATKKANEQAISYLVQDMKEANKPIESAINKVIVRYNYTEAQSRTLVEKFWNMDEIDKK